MWTFQGQPGPESVAVQGRVHCNDLLATRDLVVAGAGVAWLPSWLAADDLRSRRLTRVLTDAEQASVEVFATCLKQSRSVAALRAVLDRLASALAS